MNKMIFRFLILINLIIPNTSIAKRVYIEYEDKLSFEGVDYKASYSENVFFHKAYIEAYDNKADKILWKKKIYSTLMNPLIEQDVQWVLIKKIQLENETLVIENERNVQYFLNIKTLELKK